MDLLNLPRLDKNSVKKSFNRAAKSYDKVGFLQKEVLSRLLGRLDYIKLSPASIVDIGCGTGAAISPLKSRYKKSKLVGVDLAEQMLRQSESEFGWLQTKRLINADFERLPFADDCFDLVFSCLALQWANELDKTLAALARIGRSGGLLMFTTFGPATLSELRDSWNQLDPAPHVHEFIDMHDIGDLMLRAGFLDPVVDSEIIRLEYDDFKSVLVDLKGIGATNAERGRQRGLMTPSKLARLEEAYREFGFDGKKYIASYEIIYGHAWLS